MDTICDNIGDDIPPDGCKNKKLWNPGKDGIANWSTQRRLLFLMG